MQRNRKVCHMHRGKKEANTKCPEEAQIWDLVERDIKSTNLKMFKELKETMSKELKGSIKLMLHSIQNIIKEIIILKEMSRNLVFNVK